MPSRERPVRVRNPPDTHHPNAYSQGDMHRIAQDAVLTEVTKRVDLLRQTALCPPTTPEDH